MEVAVIHAALHIPNFNFGPPDTLAPTLAAIVEAAEANGFTTISVMDHYFQISHHGPASDPMLEAYTALSFIAAHTRRVQVGALVTGVTYRQPAFLLKQVNSLDVLSQGRSFFGIGAAWNEQESTALGFPFPPVRERFARLEEVLRLAQQMWADDTSPFNGTYYQLPEPMNHPLPLAQPHPPILIGGGGEQKTLLLVAKYADACNLFARMGHEVLQHKLDVLKRHCEAVDRDYATIEKTASLPGDVRQGVAPILEECRQLARLGFTKVFFTIPDKEQMTPLDTFGQEIIPALAEL